MSKREEVNFFMLIIDLLFDREQRSKSGLKNCLVVVVVQYFLTKKLSIFGYFKVRCLGT